MSLQNVIVSHFKDFLTWEDEIECTQEILGNNSDSIVGPSSVYRRTNDEVADDTSVQDNLGSASNEMKCLA